MAFRRVAIALLLATACSRADRAQSTIAALAAQDTVSLDSCATLDAKSAPQRRVLEPGETVPPPHQGSWTATKPAGLDSFRIIIPTVARTRLDSTRGSYFISELPGCRYFCGLEIDFIQDSVDRPLEDYAATLRIVDTAEDPDAELWRPGTPRPIRLTHADGLIMETPCGDCTSGQIIVKRGHTIAHIGYFLDDRDGFQPGLVCRLVRTASTFAWRP